MKNFLCLALLLSTLSLTFTLCRTRDCNNIPKSFSSKPEALKIIKGSSFKVKDSIDVNSQYIKSANYYSCDGQTGFFVYAATSGSEYFNSNVPIELWREFKKTSLKDSFYEREIGKYRTAIIVDVIIR